MYGNEAAVRPGGPRSGLPREGIFVTTKLLPGDASRAPEAIVESLRSRASTK